MQKNAGDIEERLRVIESVRLFKQPPPQPDGGLPEAKVLKILLSMKEMAEVEITSGLMGDFPTKMAKRPTEFQFAWT